jgi:hypothetical protein
MVDTVVAFEHETVKTLDNTMLLMVQVETMKLKKIINEIIPLNEWYFRSAADLNLSILDDPAKYQHRVQLKKMTAKRDESNNAQRWSTTALEFTASVHKPKDNSFCAAARRALIVLTWMEHGRNRAKLASHSPAQRVHEEKYR